MSDQVIEGYAAAVAALMPRYEQIAPAVLYAPMAALLPQSRFTAPAHILDIGACNAVTERPA